VPSARYGNDQLLIRQRDVAAKDKFCNLDWNEDSGSEHTNLFLMLPR
jgi:hypothetical protein